MSSGRLPPPQYYSALAIRYANVLRRSRFMDAAAAQDCAKASAPGASPAVRRGRDRFQRAARAAKHSVSARADSCPLAPLRPHSPCGLGM